jgi:hypothetical protein
MSSPAVVVAGHSRPESLSRLLSSLGRANHNGRTDLVISIDGGSPRHDEVLSVARAMTWDHGTIDVVEQPQLGLVQHFLTCGDLTQRYGAVVFLEDDLVVGPNYHRWAQQAITATGDHPDIAGVCLSAPWFDGYRHLPFEPVNDGSSGFYAQVPWYHGMVWTERQWKEFRSHDRQGHRVSLHSRFDQLDGDEWFPELTRYLVSSGRHYLLPRVAHASNWCDPGTHFDGTSDVFQVPLDFGETIPSEPLTLEQALAVYDDHMEIEPDRLGRLCPDVAEFDFTVDLLGVRHLASITTPWVITTRPVLRAEKSWGTNMRPLLANIVYGVAGDSIALARRADVIDGRLADRRSRAVLADHAFRGRQPGPRALLSRVLGSAASGWFARKTS